MLYLVTLSHYLNKLLSKHFQQTSQHNIIHFLNHVTRFSIYSILVVLSVATTFSATNMNLQKNVQSKLVLIRNYKSLFIDMSYITEDCCRKLVHMGHSCHTKLVKYVLTQKKINEISSWNQAKHWSSQPRLRPRVKKFLACVTKKPNQQTFKSSCEKVHGEKNRR